MLPLFIWAEIGPAPSDGLKRHAAPRATGDGGIDARRAPAARCREGFAAARGSNCGSFSTTAAPGPFALAAPGGICYMAPAAGETGRMRWWRNW